MQLRRRVDVAGIDGCGLGHRHARRAATRTAGTAARSCPASSAAGVARPARDLAVQRAPVAALAVHDHAARERDPAAKPRPVQRAQQRSRCRGRCGARSRRRRRSRRRARPSRPGARRRRRPRPRASTVVRVGDVAPDVFGARRCTTRARSRARPAAARRGRAPRGRAPTSASTTCEPMKPAPPVTRTRTHARTRGSRIVNIAPPCLVLHVELARRAPRRIPWRSRDRGPRPPPGRARPVALERDVEDAREIVGRNAAAGVAHGDVGVVGQLVVDAGLDDDRAVARRVADRVLQQVAQRAQHLGRRHLELGRRADEPALEVHALGRRDRRGPGEHVGDEIAERAPARTGAAARPPGSGSARTGRRRARRDGRPPRASCAGSARPSPGSSTTPSSSASTIARIPASGVRRSCDTQATSSRRDASSVLLARPRLVEPRLRRRELASRGRRARRARCARAGRRTSPSRRRSGGPRRRAPGSRAPIRAPEHERHDDRDTARGDEHHDERGEVVLGDEHRARRGVGARGDRDHRAARSVRRSARAIDRRRSDAQRERADREPDDASRRPRSRPARARRARSRVPPVADAPDRHEMRRLARDRLRSSRGCRRTCTVTVACRRRCSPRPASSSSSRRNARRGPRREEHEQVELARREREQLVAATSLRARATSMRRSPATIAIGAALGAGGRSAPAGPAQHRLAPAPSARAARTASTT